MYYYSILALLIGSSDSHFNNLCFRKSQNINDCSNAHVAILFVSSKVLKRRLLKLFLDHPMNYILLYNSILVDCINMVY